MARGVTIAALQAWNAGSVRPTRVVPVSPPILVWGSCTLAHVPPRTRSCLPLFWLFLLERFGLLVIVRTPAHVALPTFPPLTVSLFCFVFSCFFKFPRRFWPCSLVQATQEFVVHSPTLTSTKVRRLEVLRPL